MLPYGAMPSDPAESSRLPMPDSTSVGVGALTAGITDPSSPGAADSPPDARALDETIARLAVDRGLCSPDELEFCRQKQKERRYASRSLGELLIESESLTKRQFMRLRDSATSGKTGTRIPGYSLQGKLGEGATATVFRGRQENLDRPVAVKVLPRRFAGNPRYVEQLYAEARMAASLNHPNMVEAYDVGSYGEYHYFVMEIVDGETVHDRILRLGRIEETETIEIILAVAKALRHAHEKGLVHRDVKPKNIMVTKAGIPKLTDLGLARLVEDRETAEAEKGKSLGTPYYMSPEQVRGDIEIGPASDIYSLGASWYFMVTGKTAFTGADSDEIMRKHVTEPLVPPSQVCPDITPGVSDMIVKMMEKEPSRRYRSCEEVVIELEAWRTYHEMRKAELSGGT